MSYYAIDNNELYHHGIKGQKWGVRRFQNPDGTRTAEGKRIVRQYKKYAAKAEKSNRRDMQNRKLKAYNKTVDEMNNGLIDKFNKEQKDKYGNDFAKRDAYIIDYDDFFNNVYSKNYNKLTYEFIKNDKYFQKAESISKKYEMTKWSDLAKANNESINKVKEMMEG